MQDFNVDSLVLPAHLQRLNRTIATHQVAIVASFDTAASSVFWNQPKPGEPFVHSGSFATPDGQRSGQHQLPAGRHCAAELAPALLLPPPQQSHDAASAAAHHPVLPGEHAVGFQ